LFYVCINVFFFKDANVALPDSKTLRADNKTFYFDCGSNARGIFLRVSEVSFFFFIIFEFYVFVFQKVRPSRFRSAITIPEKFWEQFVSNMKEFIDKIEVEKATVQPPQQNEEEGTAVNQ
jgi:hypothetical protein